MKYTKTLLIVIVILGLYMTSVSVIAEPVAEVTFDPVEPTPVSTVTATATITSDDEIDEVWLTIQECNPTTCFRRENVSMTLSGNDYITEFTLEKSMATYFQYYLAILSDGTWYETDLKNVTLKVDADDGGTNGGNSSGNSIPGFELVSLLIAIVIGILLFKRKRLR